MKTPRVYIDTSVLGGYFEREFSVWSVGIVDDFRAGRLIPVLSDLLAAELADAPARVRTLHAELLGLGAENVGTDDQVLDLVEAYERHRVLGPRYRNDMLHIALATIAAVDVVVSWNFKHIVRLDKIRMFNAVNREQGYAAVTILTPREVTTHGRE
jgi:hypothetical protein